MCKQFKLVALYLREYDSKCKAEDPNETLLQRMLQQKYGSFQVHHLVELGAHPPQNGTAIRSPELKASIKILNFQSTNTRRKQIALTLLQ